MSATNRGGLRFKDDTYFTPEWCVHALLREVRLPGSEWLEPSAGGGAIIQAVQRLMPSIRWTAMDLRPECADQLARLVDPNDVCIRDYLTAPPPVRPDVIIGNPPYSLAMEFVRHSLGRGAVVAFLLRLPFLASQRRAGFFREHCPDVYVLPRRPSFTPNGKTDSTEYAWFVWSTLPQRSGRVQVLEVTP